MADDLLKSHQNLAKWNLGPQKYTIAKTSLLRYKEIYDM